jgi:hypothetical protein
MSANIGAAMIYCRGCDWMVHEWIEVDDVGETPTTPDLSADWLKHAAECPELPRLIRRKTRRPTLF